MSKTPKLDALTKTFDQFLFDIEKDAEGFMNEVQGVNVHRQSTFVKAKAKLADKKAALDSVDQYLDKLDELSNGPPTEGDSSGSSDNSKN